MKPYGRADRFKYMRTLSLTILSAVFAASSAFAADRVEKPLRGEADASQVHRVVIDIPASSLVITTHDSRTVAVEGRATRTYRGDRNRDKATALLEDARVILTRRGRTLYIERDLGRGDRFWNSPNATQIELDITIPAGYPVEIDQNAGEIKIDGAFGDVDVTLGAGDLDVTLPERLVGQVDAATTVGELHTDFGARVVEKSGVMAGSTTFVNPGGTTKVRLRVRAGNLNLRLSE